MRLRVVEPRFPGNVEKSESLWMVPNEWGRVLALVLLGADAFALIDVAADAGQRRVAIEPLDGALLACARISP